MFKILWDVLLGLLEVTNSICSIWCVKLTRIFQIRENFLYFFCPKHLICKYFFLNLCYFIKIHFSLFHTHSWLHSLPVINILPVNIFNIIKYKYITTLFITDKVYYVSFKCYQQNVKYLYIQQICKSLCHPFLHSSTIS